MGEEDLAAGERQAEEVLAAVGGVRALDEVQGRIASYFHRREMRERVRRYLEGLLTPVERKNSWQLAEGLGEAGPQGVQRLFTDADWDAEAVRDELRTYVVEHLADERSGVLVIDETGFVKKGTKSAGGARHYSGTAGRRANQPIRGFLLYASDRGAAFIHPALDLPGRGLGGAQRPRGAPIPPWRGPRWGRWAGRTGGSHAAAIPPSWPTTGCTAPWTRRCTRWCGWQVDAGRLRKALSRPRGKWGSISTRCGAMTPGTALSPWPCSPMPPLKSPA